MATRTCRTCKEEFVEYQGKPGFIDECPACVANRGGDVTPTVANDGGEDWQPIPKGTVEAYKRKKLPSAFNHLKPE
jgi:hypothetical protein